jgi:hypothetical protein
MPVVSFSFKFNEIKFDSLFMNLLTTLPGVLSFILHNITVKCPWSADLCLSFCTPALMLLSLSETCLRQMQSGCIVLADKEAGFQLAYNKVQKNQLFLGTFA